MIGNVNKLGTGFKGLAAYLEHGHQHDLQPDRVDWIESRNLPTRDPECAARLMAATARDSERVEKPVYHFSISFDPGDPVDRETMRRVADRTLNDLGLREHQVLIVAHKDTHHPHLHFMVNTVHPERRTTWRNSWDYARIEKSLRQQEADLGLRVVPGKHAQVPEHARDRVQRAPQRVRGDAEFLERVRTEAGPHLTGARSWGDLERGLAGHGLALQIKGPGFVVTDGVREVKASQIDAAASRMRLERRLGSFTNYRARQAVAGRTLDERAPIRTEPARSPHTRAQVQERTPGPRAPERAPEPQQQRTAQAPPAARPAVPSRPRTYGEAAREFSREARALYEDPRAARRAFLEAAQRRGPDRAAETLRDRPQSFGALRPGADHARSARAADAAYDYARQQGARLRPASKQAAHLLREAHDHQQTARGVERATEAAAHAGREPARLAQARREGLHAVRGHRARAAEVWTEPGRALRGLEAYARRFGLDEAARAVREVPEHFGALRGVEERRYMGLVRGTSYDDARARAVALSADVRTVGRAYFDRPTPGDVHRAVQHSREAGRALDAARGAHARLAHVSLQGNVREAASRLMAAQIGRGPQAAAQLARQLVPMLPMSAAGLVKQALQIGKDMAMGHDRERERERGLSL